MLLSVTIPSDGAGLLGVSNMQFIVRLSVKVYFGRVSSTLCNLLFTAVAMVC